MNAWTYIKATVSLIATMKRTKSLNLEELRKWCSPYVLVKKIGVTIKVWFVGVGVGIKGRHEGVWRSLKSLWILSMKRPVYRQSLPWLTFSFSLCLYYHYCVLLLWTRVCTPLPSVLHVTFLKHKLEQSFLLLKTFNGSLLLQNKV